jgi:hypothetical protein
VAGDLIPPPSPAGRPAPDAMAGVRAPADEPPPPPPAEPDAAPPGESPYRSRFGFVWGALAGVAVCMLALAGVLAATMTDDSAPPLARNWSPWQPSTSEMFKGAQEIAAHVARGYQLDSGQQLTTVASGPMEYALEPVGVAVQPRGGQVEVLDDGPGLLYGVRLLSEEDKTAPKRVRDRLLLRQGLELALYSFRYLDDVTMVAVALPAEKTDDDTTRSRALFYRPGDLLPLLQTPLSRTLSPTTPKPEALSDAEAARIDSLVLRNRFDSSIQALDGTRRYFVFAEPDIID